MKGTLLAFLQDLLSNALLAVIVLMLIALVNIGSGGIRTAVDFYSGIHATNTSSFLASLSAYNGLRHGGKEALTIVRGGQAGNFTALEFDKFVVRVDSEDPSLNVAHLADLISQTDSSTSFVVKTDVISVQPDVPVFTFNNAGSKRFHVTLFADGYLIDTVTCTSGSIDVDVSIVKVDNFELMLTGCT